MLMELACTKTREDARVMEKWYKTGNGKAIIRILLQEGYPFTEE